MSAPGDLTELLVAARAGDRDTLDRLFEKVYAELHALAHRQLAARGSGQTLSTTALVHEAYLKLVDSPRTAFHDRRHFFNLAARAMRQIVIDYARRAQAKKRGGEMVLVVGDPGDLAPGAMDGRLASEELLALDRALDSLELESERLARIVELRFFGGLSVEESAEVLHVSPRTIKRDWRKARAFLYHAIEGEVAV
jgi:RNA polymerase sigma factor (TIGR02999 family)